MNNIANSYIANECELPKISIVTPSYNQGKFIEQTIQSILKQNYPNLEYLILDGLSNDDTVKIIRQYENYLDYWVSEADEGAGDAIEKGRQKCHGELFNWLNSDDYLLPNTLLSLGTIANKFPDYDIYAFIGLEAWDNAPPVDKGLQWLNMELEMLSYESVFAQESTFVRTLFLQTHQIKIRKEYNNIFDTVFYREMLAKGAKVLFVEEFGGVIRHHPLAKTTLGIPTSDYQKAKLLEKEIFTWQRRLWRKIYKSRLQRFIIPVCNTTISLNLLRFLVSQPEPNFNICKCIKLNNNQKICWELLFK